ncbi:uncharacterized protein F4822DRAFT_144881 [Hypoxylon trugodes]|uniref:uncharacterized protein n=1 Tax=Hypoxylon trugodes TaxID=326681 RepID=UPI00219ED8E9|nr:uncharacterized protein F4822DRAFT_144881 [Hypoxylon trugodes]KAI1392891.1 hypothetical protein F4822DRAFT_144881 [Hypoxylon trugodes]
MGAPVILCGKTEDIGRGVIASLKPEYDVIHFVMTPEAGVSQIPAILKGEQAVPSDSTLGSKDYSKPPVAIILGGGYDDAGAEVMMKASSGIKPMPWLRPDLSKAAPPLGPEYGKALVARIKELLAQLQKQGEMNEEKVQWY